jgi:hypothetical protein
MATTAASEKAYSPDDPGSRNSGRKPCGLRGHFPVDPADNVLDHHHAVVDQKTERNDDGGDRDLLQRDSECAHAYQREHHGKGNDHGRDQPGSQAKKQDDQRGNDDEGLKHA